MTGPIDCPGCGGRGCSLCTPTARLFRHRARHCRSVVGEYYSHGKPELESARWRLTDPEGRLFKPGYGSRDRAFCPDCQTLVFPNSVTFAEIRT